MTLWTINAAGRKEFCGGQHARELAAQAADACTGFVPDDEDELVSDDLRTCYNCRYRRWTVASFECMLAAII